MFFGPPTNILIKKYGAPLLPVVLMLGILDVLLVYTLYNTGFGTFLMLGAATLASSKREWTFRFVPAVKPSTDTELLTAAKSILSRCHILHGMVLSI